VSDIRCLKTTVRNISGARMIFGYLPPHGKDLDSNEEISFYGNLFEIVAGNARKRNSLAADLQAGRLVVTQTPAPHYYDAENDTVRILEINDGVLTHDDPCWGRYVSSGVQGDSN
jgi:hypothetical protein